MLHSSIETAETRSLKKGSWRLGERKIFNGWIGNIAEAFCGAEFLAPMLWGVAVTYGEMQSRITGAMVETKTPV